MAESCERMLPSNETLPILTTRPPMSPGSMALVRIDGLAEAGAEDRAQPLGLFIGERRGGRHRGADDPGLLVGEGAVLVDDFGKRAEAAFLQQHLEKVPRQRAGLEPVEKTPEGGQAIREQHLGVGHEFAEARLAGQGAGGRFEFGEQIVGFFAAIGGHCHQGFRVAASDGAGDHRAASISLK